jgi:dTDP-4-dehydrorhamnose reductase
VQRLLVTGSTGYLGSELLRRAAAVGWSATGSGGSAALDVRDTAAVERLVEETRPDAIVHTAYRLSGPDMESTNVDGAATVARVAAAAGVRLVHLSTDVVFDGTKCGSYREEDSPRPLYPYARSKAEAERAVAGAHPGALVVRTSLVYGGAGPSPHERLALAGEVAFYVDEIRSPVQVTDLAEALLELARLDVAGPLHVAGADDVSRYDLACLVVAAHGGDPDALRAGESRGSGRPLNCALDSSRARALLRTRLRGVREVLA